jgi:hypothetical protein
LEKLIFGGLHEKHAVQRGIWEPTQHSLWDQGKPRKTLIEFADIVGEREREKKVGGGSERHYRVGGGVIETIWQFEGSQAVPASPSGRGEDCIWDLFNFYF